MSAYTIILLRPDYIASLFGQDTWMGTVDGDTIPEAIHIAQHIASSIDHDLYLDLDADPICPDDYFVIAVIQGRHMDVKP